MLTSKNKADRRVANARIRDGNEPNFPRFVTHMAAANPLITNQLWNKVSISRLCGVGCPSLGVKRRKTAPSVTIVEPIHQLEDFRPELEIGWSNFLPPGGID